MLMPLLNDAAQRLLTLNKSHQRAFLRDFLEPLGHGAGTRALDFGCGTGLFIPTLARMGYACEGLDIDQRLTDFAAWRYPYARFHNCLAGLEAGRYDLILANCCFHHIPDETLGDLLGAMKTLLAPGGRIAVIDIVAKPTKASPLHKAILLLERGAYLRTAQALERLAAGHLSVEARRETHTPILWPGSSAGHDMLALILKP
jgi:2-polyprenyl-3-methyl-5-hydroxy-6-metoxy-1,4-benzoquinol methylase